MKAISMRMTALGLVAAVGLVVAACAPSEPENGAPTGAQTGATPGVTAAPGGAVQGTPAATAGVTGLATPTGGMATPATGTGVGAPGAATAGTGVAGTPTSEVLGAQATPGVVATPRVATTPVATATPGTATTPSAQQQDERTSAEILLDDVDSFNGRLDGLTGGILPGDEPLPSDLPGIVQEAALLLHGLHAQSESMDVEDRENALETMGEAVGKMAEVFEVYHDNIGERISGTTGVTGTPGATGTPAPVVTPRATGTPGTATTPGTTGTPGTAAGATMQFDQEIQQIQDDISDMDGQDVTGLEISELLLRMQTGLDGMSQQAAQVQTDDLEALFQAMSDLREVAVDYAAQAYETDGVGATGTGTTPLPTPGTGGAMGTPTPSTGGTTPGMMGTPTPSTGGGMMTPTPRP